MEPIKSFKNSTPAEAIEHALELSGPQAVFFAEYQALIIRELLKKHNSQPMRILDYGCGDGTMAYLVHALLPNARIQGVDNSEELIEIARGWYGALNDRLSFDTKINDQYDFIYVANVLHHIKKSERAALFAKLTSQLTPNGILMILEFNPFNPLEVWRFYRNKEERGNQMILPLSLKKLLTQFGKTDVYYFRKIYVITLEKS